MDEVRKNIYKKKGVPLFPAKWGADANSVFGPACLPYAASPACTSREQHRKVELAMGGVTACRGPRCGAVGVGRAAPFYHTTPKKVGEGAGWRGKSNAGGRADERPRAR
jgi:hypothetical protein